MIHDKLPAGLTATLSALDPDLRVIRAERHSAECYTISAMSPDHHAVRGRMNLSQVPHWTWVPLSMDQLTLG